MHYHSASALVNGYRHLSPGSIKVAALNQEPNEDLDLVCLRSKTASAPRVKMASFTLLVIIFAISLSCFALTVSVSQGRCPSDAQLDVVMSDVKQTISEVLDQCERK